MSMDDLSQFKQTYITECFELLADMEERLLGLDESQDDRDALNAIFRCAHSIKGGAGAFGFDQIMKFTHILEALLDGMREGKIPPTREAIDTLLKAQDVVFQMVSAANEDRTMPEEFGQDVAAQLNAIAGGDMAVDAPKADSAAAAEEAAGEQHYAIDFVPHSRLLATGNEPLLLLRELASLGEAEIAADVSRIPSIEAIEAEDCYIRWQVKLVTEQPESAIREVFEFVEDECDLTIENVTPAAPVSVMAEIQPPKEEAPAAAAKPAADAAPQAAAASPAAMSIRVDISKVDKLINMVGEVVITQAMLMAQTKDLPQQQFADLLQGVDELSQHTRELQESVMSIRMQPVKSIFSRMPRIVRDVSTQLGKDIRLEMVGENTEVDKTIIEQLSDPLTHLIRNALDHGIEMPDARTKAGKPAQGCITLCAEHRGGRIAIEIIDDGGGINRSKVFSKAVEKGLVDPAAELSDDEIDNLIFLPGFSTADVVSNISGRGVGMDVVKRNIESLGGVVYVKSDPGKGSVFSISLPLTLAILDGMIIRVGSEPYIIPINHIIETLRPREGEVQRVADGNAVINVRGNFVPLLYLHRVFDIPEAVTDPCKGLVVLVENGKQQVGIMVDELVGQQQVVIKSLEENTDPVEGVSGATILGDGMVSLILDIGALCKLVDSDNNVGVRAA